MATHDRNCEADTELPAPLPYLFVSLEVIPCTSGALYGDGSVIWFRGALHVTDASALSMISINSVPVLRPRSADKDEWLTPTDLIYDRTARVIRRDENKLAGITDSLQAIAMRNLLRIAIKRIIARAKTNKQSQECDTPEVVKRITTPHFCGNDYSTGLSKFELAIVIRSVAHLRFFRKWDGCANARRKYFQMGLLAS